MQTVPAPPLWPAEITALRMVTPTGVGQKRPAVRDRVYASPDFAWLLFGKKPQEEAKTACPRVALRKLVAHLLPRYDDLLGR
eukprot:902463-Alexandrium_andersonii.AAC.1